MNAILCSEQITRCSSVSLQPLQNVPSLQLLVCSTLLYSWYWRVRRQRNACQTLSTKLIIFRAFSHVCPHFFQNKLEHKEQQQLHKCLTFLRITPVTILEFWRNFTNSKRPSNFHHPSNFCFPWDCKYTNQTGLEELKAMDNWDYCKATFSLPSMIHWHSCKKKGFWAPLLPNNRETYLGIRSLKQRTWLTMRGGSISDLWQTGPTDQWLPFY